MNSAIARTGICCAAGLSLLAACGGAPLLLNGGFDDVKDGKTVGWNPVGTKYVYRDGEGRSGTRALCFSNDDPRFYSFPGQSVALKAGKMYTFEVWARTENLQGTESGASICLEWTDAKGAWLGGAYAEGVKGTKDWTRLVAQTPRIPTNAVHFRVQPYVRKGMVGKAWFDDVAVTECVPKLISGVYSTAYRNQAVEGPVTFKAALDLTDGDRQSVRVHFTYQDETGAFRVVPADGRGELVRDVAALKKGWQKIGCLVHDAAGALLGSAEMTFTRLERMPVRATWIDSHGRAIVDGKPYFPLGMYWGAIVTNKLETYAKGPFNCLMPYRSPKTADLMDLCAEKGLKVIYSVKDIYSGTRWAPNGIRTEADERQYIESCVARFKNHPALLAWYLNDEMPLTMLPRLAARRDLMEELDPGHPGWVVLYQYSQIRDYLPSFDVIGTDPYPVSNKSIAMAAQWTRATATGTMGCKPLWQVPQAFNWAAYKKTPEDRAKFRAPTEAELRSMCWQCIANGANGLVLYSYFDLEKEPNGETFEKRWGECCRVGGEIRALIPVLLSVERAGDPVLAAPAEGGTVSTRVWWQGDAAYLLVVNETDAPATVRIPLAKNFTSASSVFGPQARLDGNSLALTIAAFEPAMVKLAE